MTTELPTVELYSDIHCPWAYLSLYRLRKIWPEYRERVRISFRALSLELKNERSTPKPTVDIETTLMNLQEPDLPIQPWQRPDWEYVPTLLPAFEAERAAALQGDEAAMEFAWAVRNAFFAKSRTICTRFELARVAGDAGLDVARFLADWDSGQMRETILRESHHGWEELKVQGSPTFVLPSGKHVWNPGAARVTWGLRRTIKEIVWPEQGGDRLSPFRQMLEDAVGEK
ncbi:MAG: DsbA family oxidoreductase [Chloroflexota bacterium]